jgi:hypothetical protein
VGYFAQFIALRNISKSLIGRYQRLIHRLNQPDLATAQQVGINARCVKDYIQYVASQRICMGPAGNRVYFQDQFLSGGLP